MDNHLIKIISQSLKGLGRIIFLSLLIMSLSITESCRNPHPNKALCIIRGKIAGLSGYTIYLKRVDAKDVTTIDSTRLKSDVGIFLFKVRVEEPGFYAIQTITGDYIPLVLERGKQIDLNADGGNLQQSLKINGSDDSNILKEYDDFTNRNLEVIGRMNQLFDQSRNRPDFARIRDSLNLVFNSLFKMEQDSVIRIIQRHPASMASLFIINQRFGPQKILSEKDHLPVFLLLDSALYVHYPDNKQVLTYHQRMALYRQSENERLQTRRSLQPGLAAPDFTLNDAGGKPHRLSDYRGHVVLLDFWAPWSAPCREQNKFLVQLYKKFRSQGFEIFGVALDNNKETWLNALKTDHVIWVQVSDLDYPNSPIVKLYDIEDIPKTFLLDRSGTIIAVNLSDKDLEIKLNEMFH
jgi:peroxiredoxin